MHGCPEATTILAIAFLFETEEKNTSCYSAFQVFYHMEITWAMILTTSYLSDVAKFYILKRRFWGDFTLPKTFGDPQKDPPLIRI